ncbi:MAG: Oxidoreductase, short-chain dehydrogenase/reductase family [Nitrospira sp.]|jgi:3-oxoacyl-[acyl-carrier protein] reductase|nr:MAG: Oxidoreductase, short-chain dehydrogenase/reductase family [Nitrospira sp.]
MNGGLAGKSAIVTGAAGGIGRAIVLRLAQDGASVVVHYRTRVQQAGEVVAAIQAKGGTAVAIQADMSRVSDARRLVTETVARFGRLDILVNNAGRFMSKPFLDTTEADFDSLIGLHAKGPYFAMQEAAGLLADNGRIVNITTAGTQMNFHGASAYLASKRALEQLTKAIAQELAPRGITVNAVAPGITDTGALPDSYRQLGVQRSPMQRVGQPAEIADVVAFLVSEEARWVTGQTIQVGGGIVM